MKHRKVYVWTFSNRLCTIQYTMLNGLIHANNHGSLVVCYIHWPNWMENLIWIQWIRFIDQFEAIDDVLEWIWWDPLRVLYDVMPFIWWKNRSFIIVVDVVFYYQRAVAQMLLLRLIWIVALRGCYIWKQQQYCHFFSMI